MDVRQFFTENDDPSSMNGRVKLPSGSSATAYGLYTSDGKTTSKDGTMLDSMRQVDISSSDVAKIFFAQSNVEALQQALRHGVFKASGQDKVVVGRQSDVELGLIMRATYFQESRKPSMTLSQHASALNRKVLWFCIPRVLNEAKGYLIYRAGIQNLPIPPPLGTVESMKGTRQIIGSRLYGD